MQFAKQQVVCLESMSTSDPMPSYLRIHEVLEGLGSLVATLRLLQALPFGVGLGVALEVLGSGERRGRHLALEDTLHGDPDEARLGLFDGRDDGCASDCDRESAARNGERTGGSHAAGASRAAFR